MFKEKTIYRWEIEGTYFYVEKELTECPDGRTQCDYWIGHMFYGTKMHAIGQMEEIPKHLLFDNLLETINQFRVEVMDENDM